MDWTEKQIKYIIQDMIEENPLACRALFSIAAIEFTDQVSTMAVTLDERPILNINPSFCRDHLQTENDVKAVLLHEFLHVLLMHTEKYELSDPLLNIALDAIINAIIYRYKGMDYSGFFVRFYRWELISFLLRPSDNSVNNEIDSEWLKIHLKIYRGDYCADDLYELLKYLWEKVNPKQTESIVLLGGHSKGNKPGEVSPQMTRLLDEILKKMDGTLIWNKNSSHGTGDRLADELQQILRFKKNRWEQSTLKILKKCVLSDPKAKTEMAADEVILPVLSSLDRRAVARFTHGGLIPFSRNERTKRTEGHLAHVYFDVSGSMSAEIDDLIPLLHHFRAYLKMPLWAFSNSVEEAKFIHGHFKYKTTSGTSIEPVFDHMRKNNIRKCLIVTDGYVEEITDTMLRNLVRSDINVVVSAAGNPEKFEKMEIPFYQLEKQ